MTRRVPIELEQAAQDLHKWLRAVIAHFDEFGSIPDPHDGRDAVRMFLDVLCESPEAKTELAKRARFADDPTDSQSDYLAARQQGLSVLDQAPAPPAPSPVQRAVDSLQRLGAKRPTFAELQQEHARLDTLLEQDGLASSVRQSLSDWRGKAWAIISQGRRMAAEGCRWLVDWKSNEAILGVGLAGPILPVIDSAVESLVAWEEARRVSDADGGKWSEPDLPGQWARRFRISLDTLTRWVKDGKIRVKKLSSKSWRIHVDDLPKDCR